jgi:hypothetical protein
MAVLTFAGWGFCSATDVNADAYSWLWIKAARNQNATLQKIVRQFHLDDEPEMLFLAPGDPCYIIRAKSCTRYYGPVILARARNNKSLRDTEYFREVLGSALAYHGTYIYHSDWLLLDHLPELEAKLKAEYEPACPTLEQYEPIPDAHLLRRKKGAVSRDAGTKDQQQLLPSRDGSHEIAAPAGR